MSIAPELAQTLAAVVDEGTMDAAARRLHITPSAVSQRVRALEDQLGRVVLVRSRPVRTTPAGDAVVRLARQLDLLQHDALTAIGADEGAMASVPLAVNADSLATWFLPPLARVAERRAVVFDLHRDDQDFTAGLLETGEVTAAVTSRERPVTGCRVRRLGLLRYEPVSTAAFAWRWFGGGVSAERLADAPLVDFDRRDDLQTRWLARRAVAAERPPRHRVPASHDFATAVGLGLGWGMLPAFQSAAGLADGSLVRLGDDAVDVPLFWQQWNLTSPLLDEIADEVVAEGRRVLAA